MERGVRVNADTLRRQSEGSEPPGIESAVLVGDFDHGPCLYLGPSGERCDQRATARGFCEAHEPGFRELAISRIAARRSFALVAALAALLPLLTDLIRELIRLFR